MAYRNYDKARWIFDGYNVRVDQRPSQAKDFSDGEDYIGKDRATVEWDKDAESSVKQLTMVNYVSRRQVRDVKLFKKIDGRYFKPADIEKFRTTAYQTPPKAALPFDRAKEPAHDAVFDTGWFLVSLMTTYTKDSGVVIAGQWRKSFEWELVLVNEAI